MPILKALQLKDGINRHYVSRKKGRSLLTSIENYVDGSIQRLQAYIKKIKEKLNSAANYTNDSIKINRRTAKTWKQKQLYKYFKWQTGEITHKKTWTWLRKGNLEKETESLLIAAQYNAMSTN